MGDVFIRKFDFDFDSSQREGPGFFFRDYREI